MNGSRDYQSDKDQYMILLIYESERMTQMFLIIKQKKKKKKERNRLIDFNTNLWLPKRKGERGVIN